MILHPARSIPFNRLYQGLEENVAAGLINRQVDGDLVLYCYTKQCVFDRAWNEYTRLARGLILHPKSGTVVATPFPKFFNVGEFASSIPDLPFEAFEKLDGSLIIIYHWDGEWRCATKGSFNSDQAQWARQYISANTSSLFPGETYLAEAIYPQNQIVIKYDKPMLALLGAYDCVGYELSYGTLLAIAGGPPFDGAIAQKHSYNHVSELLEASKDLPPTREGFVLRFINGHRLKVKGEAYLRLHRAVSRLTPLAVWEMLFNQVELTSFKRDLPEEFWEEFDTILSLLSISLDRHYRELDRLVGLTKAASDKQLALWLPEFGSMGKFIFMARKGKTNKLRKALLMKIRPNNNHLEGYK